MRRTVALLIVVAILATPLAAANRPPAPNVLTTFQSPEGSVLLAWSPVPDAVSYIVYRGATPETLVPIAQTTQTFFIDHYPPGAFYGVATHNTFGTSDPHTSHSQGPGGNCVMVGSNLHISIQLSNCGRN